MRIINRHYSHLLVGYDGILDFSRQFAEAWEKESQSRAQSYRRELDEYQRRYDSWLAANQPRVDAYNTAYEAWFRSETPTREVYERALPLWKDRHQNALRRAEAGVQKAQARFSAYQRLALVLGIISAFAWMVRLCWLFSFRYSIYYWLVLTLPVIASAVFAILSITWEARLHAFTRRRQSLQSALIPKYKPLSPPPVHPHLPPEPEKPVQRSMPGFTPMAELWWDRLSEKPADVIASDLLTYGSKGEALLVEALKDALLDDFLAISGMKVERSTDADVVVIGKNGIWVLESKYLSGWVTYSSGQGWTHIKNSPDRNRSSEEGIERYDYTDEWQREKKSIETTLNMHMKRPHPPVLGGIAFTHDAELKCDDLPPVQIGWIRDWCERIKSTQCDDRFTERDLVECAHHILNYSHRLDDKNSQASAGDLAFNLKNLYFEKLH